MPQFAEDNLLVQRARCGDQEAAAILCLRYTPLIRKAARRYPIHWRADLEQEGWAAFLKALHSFNPNLGVPFAGYAKAIVYGDVRSAARRDTRHRDRISYASASFDVDGEDSVSTISDRESPQAFEDVEWAMTWPVLFASAGLSAREALCMRATMTGVKPADLACQEGVSVETVKTWRKRGLQKLRRIWVG